MNIEKLGDDQYRVALAVAGFSREDLDIVARQNMLTISGRKADEASTASSIRTRASARAPSSVSLSCRLREGAERRPQGRPADN